MGYNLAIGEAVLSWSKESVDIYVEGVSLDNAPAFGEPTDKTNQRWPSYSSWADFCRNLDIMDLMFNERNKGQGYFSWKENEFCTPLIQQHPGTAPITQDHLEYLEEKIAAYKAKFPDHIAKFPGPKEGVAISTFGYSDEDLDPDPRNSGTLCRAEWLHFWMKWALENCEKPTFYNS